MALYQRERLSFEQGSPTNSPTPSVVIASVLRHEGGTALRARRGPHQRVIMATHYCSSQADEWVSKKQIKPDGRVYRDTAIAEIRA